MKQSKSSDAMKRILVTGGAGFIGSNLIKKLIRENLQVVSLDNYFTGSTKNHVDGASYITGETININEILKNEYFSHVYHFGEYSRVEKSFDDIDSVFKLNHEPIHQVLRFVKETGAKIIYSGSSTKFGDDGNNAFASPYAWTKKCNSDLVKLYSQWFEINYAICYFYNAYGENEINSGDYATLIGKYVKLSQQKYSKLPVVKPGSQRRNFTYVGDIVEALYLIGLYGNGDNYGIGADESYSILEVAEMFRKDIEWLPERKGNRMSAKLITDRTKELGWTPRTQLKSFIDRSMKRTSKLKIDD